MSYLSRRLAVGEEVVHEGRFNWVQKLWPWIALLALGIIVVGVIIWVAEMFRMGTTRMMVTNRRVLLKRGFFTIRVDELTLNSVEGAEIHQGILGRIFGYGKLVLRGKGESRVEFPTMDRPGRFRAAIETARMRDETRVMHPVDVDDDDDIDETPKQRRRRLIAERRALH